MARALGWNPQVAETGEQLIGIMNNSRGAWPDVLILDLHLHDMDARQLIARLEKECGPDTLPPIVVVAESTQSYAEQEQLAGASDVLLMRPLTSSALFNAVNATVSKGPDTLERVLQSTNFDEFHAQWLHGVSVLVVDDSDINLEVAQRILERQGAQVTTCSDGMAALEHVRLHPRTLDIVLMDVQMPILDGNAATRRIRTELKLATLPIVALTAGALVAERQRALEARQSQDTAQQDKSTDDQRNCRDHAAAEGEPARVPPDRGEVRDPERDPGREVGRKNKSHRPGR